MIVDTPATDHVTTLTAVVRKEKNVEIVGTPLPDPTVVHATSSGKEKIEGRSVAGKSWKRNRAHPSVVRQRCQKGCNSSITVTADIHSEYGNDNSGNIMSYSPSPPGDDRANDIDRSIVKSTVSPNLALNSLSDEFVPVSMELRS